MNVRIFGYRGIVQVHQRLIKQFSSDSVFTLDEPYLWSQLIAVPDTTGVAASSIVQPAPDLSTLLRIEIPDGKQVRFEINPQGPLNPNARSAGNLSPRMSGYDQFPWAPGYTISLCDAAAFL